MFYIMNSLTYNSGLQAMSGGDTVMYVLKLGSVIIGIFAVIFLLYTYSFIVKRRKKEFGLYNILGLEKRHIGIVIAYETLFVAVISLIAGFLFGILLDKLMFLVLAKILNADFVPEFFVSPRSILITLILFVCIFAMIFLYSFLRVRLSQPIELLKGGETGEKEPKTKFVLALLGAVSLIAGYVCSVMTKNGIAAIELFFIAVILVIIGTYLLFTAGSIALLKALRKNKKYYYKTGHFIGVSGMMYRMKQNAVGLASICILASMLLVAVSTTTSFMAGKNAMLNEWYPYDFMMQSNADEESYDMLTEDIRKIIEEKQMTVESEIHCEYLTFVAVRKDNEFVTKKAAASDNPSVLVFMTASAYNGFTGENKTLDKREVLICENNSSYRFGTVKLFDAVYSVTGKVEPFIKTGLLFDGKIIGSHSGLYIIVSDYTELKEICGKQKAFYGENSSDIRLTYAADFADGRDKQISFASAVEEMARAQNYNIRSRYKVNESDNFMSLYGGLFFLGIYLGTLFLMDTILIIYYKQISEGFEDKKRFEIMQKVGMSYSEIKQSIGAQTLIVFFLPLFTAGLHIAFAFPMINRILGVMGLTSTKIFALCSLACFGIFALIYVIVYFLTAQAYYKIVRAGS